MKEKLQEKLRKEQSVIRILGICTVLLAVIAIFLPIYKVTQTMEVLGIKETISAKFSILQIITQNKNIAIDSSSALGEFNGFSSVSMVDLLGDGKVAWIVTASLIALSINFVVYGIVVLFASIFNSLQKGTIKYFMLSFFVFMIYPVFIFTITEETTGYSETIPIAFIIIMAVVFVVLMEVFDKLFANISINSTEIFLSKYKNEDKEWYSTFITDIMEYINNSNFPIENEGFLRFLDAQDRNDLRKNKKSETEDKE